MIDLNKLPQENYNVEPQLKPDVLPEDYGFFNALGDAVEATFPFVQTIKHPMQSDEFTATEEEINDFYTNEFPSLSKVAQDSIQGNGGYRNRSQVDTILARVEGDQQLQENLYEYGGLAGSIGLQVGASLVNPADWAIAIGTFGAGKYLTTMKTINSVMNNYRKSSSIALGALEGAAGGYLSETLRQETQSIEDTDARFNTLVFGSVLGGSLGASGWFKMISEMNPEQQANLFKSMDIDDVALQTEIHNSYKSVGSAGYYGTTPSIDVDDINEATPRVSVFSKWFSPRAFLYSQKLPSLRRMVERLAPSTEALVDADGKFVVQNIDTAWDYKNKIQGQKNILSKNLADIYTKINQDRVNAGMPKLSEEEFGIAAYQSRVNTTMAYRNKQAEIDVLEDLLQKDKDNIELKRQLEELKNTEVKPEFASEYDEMFHNAFNDYYKYMEDELYRPKINKQIAELEAKGELSEADLEELTRLQSWTPDKYNGYTTRIFNKDAINFNLDTVQTLVRALQNSPTAKAMMKYASKEDLQKYMDEQVEIAKEMSKKIQEATDLNALRDVVKVTKGSSKSSDMAGGGFAIGRKIDIDESLLGDLVQRNMFDVVDFYHQDMSGKLSVRKAFNDVDIDSWEDFKDTYFGNLSEEFQVAGMDKAERDKILNNLEIVYKDIRGIDQIAKNPDSFWQRLKRGVMAFNNIRFAPNFGLISLNELGPTIQMGGVKTLSYMMPSIKAAIKKINNKDAGIDFINELQAMGIGGDLQHSRSIERYTEGSHLFENNKIVNTLRKGENAVFRYGGLTAVTDVMKSMLSAGFTMRMVNLSKKVANGGTLSYKEQALLSRIGMSEEQLLRFHKQPIIYDEQGLLKSFNTAEWDTDLSDEWEKVLNRVTKGNILEPTSMDLPMLMTDPDKPLNAILTQYYRFPIAAQTNLLSKAVNDKDMGALLAMMVSGLMTATVEVGKVYGMVKLGELAGYDIENPYDDIVNDKDQQLKLAGKLFNTNPMFGVMPMAVNVGAAMGGYNIPGTDYTPYNASQMFLGPTISNVDALTRGIGDIVQQPGEFTDSQKKAIYMNLPRVPFMYDLSKHYLMEEF